MFSFSLTHRVAYYETDTMGYVHHSNYVRFFEIARTEMMRAAGLSYADMEASGVMMPVLEAHCRYHRPARYDDVLTLKATVRETPVTRIHIDYEITNAQGQPVCTGSTSLAFVDAATRKPRRAPEEFVQKLIISK